MLVRYWPSLNLREVSAPAIGSYIMYVCYDNGASEGRYSWLWLSYGHGHAAEVLVRPLVWCLSGALSVVVSSQSNVLISYQNFRNFLNFSVVFCVPQIPLIPEMKSF